MAFWDEPKYRPIETDDFQTFAGEYAGSVRRWDEIRDAYWGQLTRNPYVGARVPDWDGPLPLFVQDLYSTPPLSVYYEIDEEAKTVIFRFIYPMDPLDD